MSRICTPSPQYPAQNEHFGVYGLPKGKKQFDDIPDSILDSLFKLFYNILEHKF